MALLNPIDLSEPTLDFAQVEPAVMGTYTFNGGKRSDKDIDSGNDFMASQITRSPLGTYTFNGGKRSDKDIDTPERVSGYDPRSPKGTQTFNGGHPSDHD